MKYVFFNEKSNILIKNNIKTKTGEAQVVLHPVAVIHQRSTPKLLVLPHQPQLPPIILAATIIMTTAECQSFPMIVILRRWRAMVDTAAVQDRCPIYLYRHRR